MCTHAGRGAAQGDSSRLKAMKIRVHDNTDRQNMVFRGAAILARLLQVRHSPRRLLFFSFGLGAWRFSPGFASGTHAHQRVAARGCGGWWWCWVRAQEQPDAWVTLPEWQEDPWRAMKRLGVVSSGGSAPA